MMARELSKTRRSKPVGSGAPHQGHRGALPRVPSTRHDDRSNDEYARRVAAVRAAAKASFQRSAVTAKGLGPSVRASFAASGVHGGAQSYPSDEISSVREGGGHGVICRHELRGKL